MKHGVKRGAVAQLGEHLLCKQGVVGSIPISSTSYRDQKAGIRDQKAEASGKVCFWLFSRAEVVDRLLFKKMEEVKCLAREGGYVRERVSV